MKLTQSIQTSCAVLAMALSLWLACASAASATTVLEIAASELPGLLAKHPNVVLQLTSTDPNCTYCVGAEAPFDAAAANRYTQPVVFARVKWPAPWRNMPTFTVPLKITGYPDQKFFKNGKEVDAIAGIIKKPALLSQAVEAFSRRSATSEGVMVVAPSPAVMDVKADALTAFLSKHDHAVVQFVSSDLNCEFCTSAELGFNEVAAKNTDKTIVYARVQWAKPWTKVPDFGALVKFTVMPKQVAFIKGQNIGAVEGHVPDTQKLQQDLMALFAKPAPSAPPVVQNMPNPSPDAAGITAQEQTAARMLMRFGAYADATKRCITPQSTINNELLKTVEDLSKIHAKSIELAVGLSAKIKTSQDYVRYTQWQEEEKVSFKTWHENTLGIPAAKATEPDNCAKLVKNAKALMEAKYVLN